MPGLISKYILPKEVDFNAALMEQVRASRQTVDDLYRYCVHDDTKALTAIHEDENETRRLKSRNMQELMDVLLTPYDKESIYRIIIQLDWISLSVKHLVIDLLAYKAENLQNYDEILAILKRMVACLEQGFDCLPERNPEKILSVINSIHDDYDETVKLCALANVKNLRQYEVKDYLVQREISAQLKDIAQHIHTSANTLEDMAIKII